MNQSVLSKILNERIFPILHGNDEGCGDLMSRVLCHYFFAPCGANDQLHLPLSMCQEECQYVQSACRSDWRIVDNVLSSAGLSTVGCASTDALIQGLAPCCIDAGIKIQSTNNKPCILSSIKDLILLLFVLAVLAATTRSGVKGAPVPVNLVIGLLSALVVILITVVIGTVCLAVIITKRKTAIRNLQKNVLSR